MTVPTYRVTPDNLVDADKKTRLAISPLLDALNRSLGLLTSLFNALTMPVRKTSSFTTDSSGNATLTVALEGTPTDVWLTALTVNANGTAPTGYTMGWTPKTNGAALNFAGLAASTAYNFAIRWL